MYGSSSASSAFYHDDESLISYHAETKPGDDAPEKHGRGIFLLILVFLTIAGIIAYSGLDIEVVNDVISSTVMSLSVVKAPPS